MKLESNNNQRIVNHLAKQSVKGNRMRKLFHSIYHCTFGESDHVYGTVYDGRAKILMKEK